MIRYERKFVVRHFHNGFYHFGMQFSVSTKEEKTERDIFLSLFFGKHEIEIGLINEMRW